MDLKKTYREQFGYVRTVTDRNSTLSYAELDFLKLAAGQSYTIEEPGKEFALVPLSGTCSVRGEGFFFERVGKRKSPFDGPAEVAYVCRVPFTVTAAEGDVRLAVCKAPAEKQYPPAYVPLDRVAQKTLGKGHYAREAAFIFPESVPANFLYIGEFWVEDGFWASYPPHKHDVDAPPGEGALDEIYYFEFDRPEGFGFQAVYSADGTLDEAYTVRTGDLVEVPRGYHPFSVAPGYKNYCLWIMAGRRRGLLSSTEEKHRWMLGS